MVAYSHLVVGPPQSLGLILTKTIPEARTRPFHTHNILIFSILKTYVEHIYKLTLVKKSKLIISRHSKADQEEVAMHMIPTEVHGIKTHCSRDSSYTLQVVRLCNMFNKEITVFFTLRRSDKMLGINLKM